MTDEPKILRAGLIKVWYEPERGILFSSHEPGAAVTISDARACTAAILELSGGRPLPLCVDFTGLKSQTKEVRDYFANDPSHTRVYTAVALIVGSFLTRVIANFYMGINKPEKPTRMFDDRQSALAWLEQFVERDA